MFMHSFLMFMHVIGIMFVLSGLIALISAPLRARDTAQYRYCAHCHTYAPLTHQHATIVRNEK